MASTLILPQVASLSRWRQVLRSDAVLLVFCTSLALLLLGYHPYAEDGGIYAAALEQQLDPALFPALREFAVAQTAHSVFVPAFALLVRVLHVPLGYALLFAQCASVAAIVAAARLILLQVFADVRVRRWALVLVSTALGLPVAGTSLYLADPYVTARSVSTPLLLWAVACLLRGRYRATLVVFFAAFAVHPIMAAWTGVLLLAVVAARNRRPWAWTAALSVCVLSGMGVVQALSPVESAASRAACLSRQYWFPGAWAWYESVGLAAPIFLLTWLARTGRALTAAGRAAATAGAVSTLAVSAGALLFVHPANGSMTLARLQPLRLLHAVSLLFVLLAGGSLLQRLDNRWLRVSACAMAGLPLLGMQRTLYSASGHLDVPWAQPVNGYVQAYAWVRGNTPVDAVFALDADYTAAQGSDAHLFRAVAMRSSLPDAAKDGGIASVVPQLAPAWRAASQAQAGLSQMSDVDRLRHITPLGATWMVLPASAQTGFVCPYRNTTAEVCRLP